MTISTISEAWGFVARSMLLQYHFHGFLTYFHVQEKELVSHLWVLQHLLLTVLSACASASGPFFQYHPIKPVSGFLLSARTTVDPAGCSAQTSLWKQWAGVLALLISSGHRAPAEDTQQDGHSISLNITCAQGFLHFE